MLHRLCGEYVESCADEDLGEMQQATALLQVASVDAVEALRSIVSNPDSAASTRVAAARMILEVAYRAVEIEDLDERLRNIESTSQEMKP